MSERILIVEDETDLAATLAYNLKREGFIPSVAHDGADALEAALGDDTPHLVLLDLMLPDMPGTEVCRRLRADARTRDVPIIILTARADEIDRVVGFEVGADDYVTKPFSVRELLLRVRAVLRRARGADATSEPIIASAIIDGETTRTAGRIRLDVSAHRAWVDDEQVRLTALEFRLLLAFIERQGRVQTRDHLLNDVWGMDGDITTRTVDTHVKRLRDKLGAAGTYIHTIRGVGYRFELDTEPE